jgi:hypothetical protein
MENPKELFDSFIQTTVSEALLVDAIELYASQEIADEGEREDFVERYSDEEFQPIVRKAVLDVVVAVVAAHRIDDDAAYRVVIDMLEVEERDDIVRAMKLTMLRKMVDDAVDDMSGVEETRFRERMAYVEKDLG